MKRRLQPISLTDSSCTEDRAALENRYGVQSFLWIDETEITSCSDNMGMLEHILSPDNLQRALGQVVSNRGSGGVDGMKTEELRSYVIKHFDSLRQSILSGKYKPQPVRKVEIPKDNGKTRPLGIPTVLDRLVQQAISQHLTPIYELQFHMDSYGFRPKRNAHQALGKVQDYINEGYTHVVDIDLAQYFDTVNRSKLVEVLSRTIRDGRVISLIHKFLNSGVMTDTKLEYPEEGVPQGSPLSPLLGNIMLNELDWELSKRGHKFVRYADDLLILCKSQRAAERTLSNTTKYIEGKLHLRVNLEKTKIVAVSQVKFLGYSFYYREGQCRLRVHPTSWDKLKTRIRTITSRSNGRGDDWRKQALTYYVRGWINYFRLADMKNHLRGIDEWLRRRLRMVIWKQWKRINTKFNNLQKLGLSRQKAWEYANTRKGYWRTANSWILSTTITNDRLKRAGYISFTDYFKKVAPVY